MALHGDLTAEQRFKASIQIASQFDHVAQVSWFGTNLYAAIKNSLKQATQQEDVIISMKKLTGVFSQQQVYVLPWLAIKDKQYEVCAIRPDIIVGYAGALHVIELKTHTIYGKREGESPADTSRYKQSYADRGAQLKKELNNAWKQAAVQALAVWARVQLLPKPRPRVYCHLISTAVEVDSGVKDAYTDTVYAELTNATVLRMLRRVCDDYAEKNNKQPSLLNDKGETLNQRYFYDFFDPKTIVEPNPDFKLSSWLFN